MRRRILWSALAVAAVTLAAGLVAGAVINRRLIGEREAELQRQADATATLIEAALRDSVSLGEDGETSVRKTLEIARAVGGHDYVEARLMGTALDRTRLALAAPLLESLGPNPPTNTVIETEVDGSPVLAFVRSVPVTLRPDGARVLIAIGSTEPLLGGNLLAQPLLISLGIGALLAAILATWASRHIGRRLDDLGVVAAAVADGDFSIRAPEDGNDDVAKLGAAFNDMADRLEGGRRRERDFLMSVGHDLRTPLTTIRGYAEALDGDEADPGDTSRIGGVLRAQADRLSRLIEDLMLLARLEAREFSLRPEAVDLSAHLKELVAAHTRRAKQARVKMVSDIGDVGIVNTDPDRFAQIVGNLVENALRYTPEGGTIRVGLRAADDAAALEISDTGPGIDTEDIPHVFERLYVAQRYRPVRPEGSGLGLAIVKEIVDAMGGSVAVDSSAGRGTAVLVQLPLSGP